LFDFRSAMLYNSRMKTRVLAAFALVSSLSVAAAETSPMDRPCLREPLPTFPFPDALSACVWRNWPCVPKEKLARILGATPEQLEAVAAEMGLPPQGDVPAEWLAKGYITLLRRNWHLMPYGQLMELVDMDRERLGFLLLEEDYLYSKLGGDKPRCDAVRYDAAAVARTRKARLALKAILAEEGIDMAAREEPRFSFLRELAAVDGKKIHVPDSSGSPFATRYVFSYFADYGAPLEDPEVGSFPEGLLQKLQRQGVNGVWLHVVLRTLAKDPKYPEFGDGCEARMANLRTLVARAAKYGIKVYLYLNEPRGMPAAFFEKDSARMALRGVHAAAEGRYALCTSSPEVRRWLADSVESVFRAAPGLGGIFTITASENLTSCASHYREAECPRCRGRDWSEMIAEVNRTMIDGMRRAAPKAKAFVWNWSWDGKSLFRPRTIGQQDRILSLLPKDGVYLMTTSEVGTPFTRGGITNEVNEYSISVPGPSDESRRVWKAARGQGLKTAAKVQASVTWELAPFPYVPAMDLVAEHAVNLAKEGVEAVMLSWTLGSAPAPNLGVFGRLRRNDTVDSVLDRIAAETYGVKCAPLARKAWTEYSRGYAEYPFDLWALYRGPQQWGPANPLYARPTGYRASMVGFPFDDLDRWRSLYPTDVWISQMDKVADGFERGSAEFAKLVDALSGGRKNAAARELSMFRAEGLHFRSCANQGRFVLARNRGDAAGMKAAAKVEKAAAKALLECDRADSRIGYECSNHYYYIPADIVEKILGCALIEKSAAPLAPMTVEKTFLDKPWVAEAPVEMAKGRLHRFTASIRTENFACVNHPDLTGPRIRVMYYGEKGEELGPAGSWPVTGTSGNWAEVNVVVSPPGPGQTARVQYFVPACITGIVHFADAKFEPYDRPPPPKPTRSPCKAIDEHGRLVWNGRRTFPLGMYFEKWDSFAESTLASFAKGPFNCVVPYGFPDRASMDACERLGLGVIYNANVYFGTRWAFGRVTSEAGEDGWIRRTVEEFKNHPALMAWYVNDEFQLNFLERLNRRYELVRSLDPDHPAWGVFMDPKEARHFVGNLDVLGVDPYPVDGYRQTDFTKNAEYPRRAIAAGGGKRPLWGVIQAFDWKAYLPDSKSLRAPTEDELRVQTWLEIASGANGLFYLAYTTLGFRGNGDSFDNRWRIVCKVASEVKEKEKFLLCDPGPAVESQPSGSLAVRTWRRGERVFALVASGEYTNTTTRVACSGLKPCEVKLAPLSHAFVDMETGRQK